MKNFENLFQLSGVISNATIAQDSRGMYFSLQPDTDKLQDVRIYLDEKIPRAATNLLRTGDRVNINGRMDRAYGGWSLVATDISRMDAMASAKNVFAMRAVLATEPVIDDAVLTFKPADDHGFIFRKPYRNIKLPLNDAVTPMDQFKLACLRSDDETRFAGVFVFLGNQAIPELHTFRKY